MLPLCDFVCVVVALTAETRHLFKYEQFSLMKKTAIFCNVSRGDTVDQVCDRLSLESHANHLSHENIRQPFWSTLNQFSGWIIKSSKWKSNSYGRIRCDVTGTFATRSSFVEMFQLHYCSTLGICHRENSSWNVSNGNWKYTPRTGLKMGLSDKMTITYHS